MGLRYGINVYQSVQDAWQGAMTSEREEPKIMLVTIVKGAIMNEMVTLSTKGHEDYHMKLNCRENLPLSVEPLDLYLHKPLEDDEVGDLAVIKLSPSPCGQEHVYAPECEGLLLRYKPKVISLKEEPVEIMKADGTFIDCLCRKFDTGNDAAACISGEMVAKLDLEDRIDYEDIRGYRVVGTDANGNPNGGECYTIEIHIKIRGMVFPVKALYDVNDGEHDLLIDMDVIGQLFDKGFTLGK